jgi:predicted phage terminase large subunit-like protein
LRDDTFVVLDVKRGQFGTDKREKVIKAYAEADGTNVPVYIEQEPGSGGKESAEATIRNLIGYACYADRPTGDKVFRADPYSVQVNNGAFKILKADWNHAFVEEHRFFPYGTYKDQVDSAAAAFNLLAGKKKVQRVT